MKPLPIGKSDFKKLIKEGCYYVDKTAVIEELFENGSDIVLFPRPRRFGKSLFMSMLNNFFDIDLKEENKNLFKNLYINKSPYYTELSKYPTIFLNFKDLKSDNFEKVFEKFKMLISNIYNNKKYIKSILNEKEKNIYDEIVNFEASVSIYEESIKYLSIWLERYHKEKVIVLMDEYDAAINEGYILGYYDEIINLLSPVLSSALKDNTSLKMGVLTGVLRVGGASLFSSFNNLKVYDVMSEQYNEYFGFTKEETKELLESYGLEKTKEVDEYYDGYDFGGTHIYNPWSILNYADERKLQPYWMNTGSNKLVKDLLSKIDNKEKIESLIKGESILFEYDKSITYESFSNPEDVNNLLNLLLVSGYVTFDRKEESLFGIKEYYRIPNKEILEDFIRIVESVDYKDRLVNNFEYEKFLMSFINDDKEYIENFINNTLPTLSYYDTFESFYHGYTLGLFNSFLNNKNFIVKSNREAGLGRYDIMIEQTDKSVGIIIELKLVKNESEMESSVEEAVKQMKEREYYKELVIDKITNIKEYVIVFCEKKAIVR